MANNLKGITIQIGGDTTQLNKALADSQKVIRDTQTELRQINSQLRFDPSNTVLLTQKHKLLGEELKASQDKLKQLKDAQAQFSEEARKTEEGEKQYRALEREIEKTEGQVKDLKKQVAETSPFSQFADKASAALKKVGDKCSEVGKQLSTKITAPIVGLATAAVKTTADFDSSMSKVAAVSGATGEDLDALRSKAREMGEQTKFSAAESADAMNYMAMAGWKTGDMLDGISGIMDLAAASGEDLATTSDIVTDALTAFGLKAEDSGHFADVLAAASSNANTNVSMMGETFKYVAPTAGALGYSVEDVSVAIGLMANAGIKSSRAGTSLNNLLTRLAKPTKEVQQAMDRLGLSLTDDEGNMKSFGQIMEELRASFGEINMPVEEFQSKVANLDSQLEAGEITEKQYNTSLEELTKQAYGAEGAEKARTAAMLAGKQGMAGLLAIVNSSAEDYAKLTGAINDCDGAAGDMAATMNDNLAGQLQILKSQLEELAISVGETLMPFVREAVEKLQSIVDWLNSLDEDTKNTIITVALVVAAIGPLLLTLGKVITIVSQIINVAKMLNVVLAANPMILIVVAVVAVIAILVELYRTCEPFRNFVNKWVGELAKIPGKIVDFFKGIPDFFKNLWNKIKTTISNCIDWFKSLPGKLKTAALSAIKEFLSGFGDLGDKLYNIIEEAMNDPIGFIKDLPGRAIEWGRDFIDGLADGILSAAQGVVDSVISIADTISSYLHFSSPDIGPLADYEKWMPDFMEGLAEGIDKNKDKVVNALSGLTDDMTSSMEIDATVSGGAYGAGAVVDNRQSNIGDITINISTSGESDPRAVADEVQDRLVHILQTQEAAWA